MRRYAHRLISLLAVMLVMLPSGRAMAQTPNGEGRPDWVRGLPNVPVRTSGTDRVWKGLAGESSTIVVPSEPLVVETSYAYPDWLIATGAPGDRLGISVASAGDVNGDGVPDIIVGADHFYGDQSGKAFVYFGGSPADLVADVVLAGNPGGSFGWAVASAGDVNGDGFDDVLVGDLGNGSAGELGHVYLYFGGSAMDSIPDLIMAGPTPGTWLGFSVASAGDLNSDGFGDIVICGTNKQGVFVYFGSATPDSIPDLVLAGGIHAQGAGDINNDGYDDIIAGDPSNISPTPSWARLYFGGSSMDTVPDLTFGEGIADGFGRCVAGGADINGDGAVDLIIGAPADNTGGSLAGRAYVFFGGAELDTIPDFILTGSGANNLLGLHVASLGDLDHDGYGDFSVTGEVALVPLAGKKGMVSFYRGGPTPFFDKTLTGEAYQDNYGWCVASVGDFDQDDTLDVLIGAPFAVYAEKRGEVYLSQGLSPVLPVLEEPTPSPHSFTLMQNYPNPFNPSTTIGYELPQTTHARLSVYDLLGREVRVLVNERIGGGYHEATLDASDLASGVYLYRLQADGFIQSRKLLLLR